MRHAGRSVTYDWSTTDDKAPAIHWAAFYSDYQHEVHKVTAGHRVTLTYNLYAVPSRVRLEGKTECLDVTTLPLYHPVKNAIEDEGFFPNGTYSMLCFEMSPMTDVDHLVNKAAFWAVIAIIGIRTRRPRPEGCAAVSVDPQRQRSLPVQRIRRAGPRRAD